jgi:hypothetical protein
MVALKDVMQRVGQARGTEGQAKDEHTLPDEADRT